MKKVKNNLVVDLPISVLMEMEVKGIVLDNLTRKALTNCEIVIRDDHYKIIEEVKTNSFGEFFVTVKRNQIHHIRICKKGYLAKKMTIAKDQLRVYMVILLHKPIN